MTNEYNATCRDVIEFFNVYGNLWYIDNPHQNFFYELDGKTYDQILLLIDGKLLRESKVFGGDEESFQKFLSDAVEGGFEGGFGARVYLLFKWSSYGHAHRDAIEAFDSPIRSDEEYIGKIKELHSWRADFCTPDEFFKYLVSQGLARIDQSRSISIDQFDPKTAFPLPGTNAEKLHRQWEEFFRLIVESFKSWCNRIGIQSVEVIHQTKLPDYDNFYGEEDYEVVVEVTTTDNRFLVLLDGFATSYDCTFKGAYKCEGHPKTVIEYKKVVE